MLPAVEMFKFFVSDHLKRRRVLQLNQLARSNTDMRLQDGHGQLGPKAKGR